MSPNVSKDCFPTPTRCYNCERKTSSHVRKESGPKEEYKRCGGCHLLTYCDKDCQREHWLRVHKSHCRFLSGKVLVKNSDHIAATCTRCIDQSQSTMAQIKSENSPKTICNVETVATSMKKMISTAFGFHLEGKKCNCKVDFALNLPFALGEVSGQYIGSTGLDAMLAHSLKILNAMYVKSTKDEHRNTLSELYTQVLKERVFQWSDILVHGRTSVRKRKYLSDNVDSLKPIYGVSNPWWKTLKFSIHFFLNANSYIAGELVDAQSLEDSRFQLTKKLDYYRQSQLKNQELVCEKGMWPNFMMWPQVVNGSLAMILPFGSRCQSCNAQLRNEVNISQAESNWKDLPCLLPYISDNGALMASCPFSINPSCVTNCQSKDVEIQMQHDKNQWKDFLIEDDLFFIEARECDFCLKLSLYSHRCSACLTVQYCSTVCQKKDLEFHKTVCSTWAKDESKRILSSGKQKDHWRSALEKL